MSNSNYNEFGLISGLSPLYFLGLVLIVISFIIQSNDAPNRILLMNLLLIITMLWVTAFFLEGTARREWCYINYSFADYVVRKGNIDTYALNMWYHNWPFYSILLAQISVILNLNPKDYRMFVLFPFVLVYAYLPFIYLILKTVLKDKKAIWLGLLLFNLGLWGGQEYLSPQGIAFTSLLGILYIVLKLQSGGDFNRQGKI
jgi:hypothetical protein